MTPEQAKLDKRRNVLLQCVGASKTVEPQIIRGRIEKGIYMICSDGFRHELTPEEMLETLAPINLVNKKSMRGNAQYLIEKVKSRREKDNISVILVKVY
jgi:serine/threonine protein phosphatase PrpC